MPDLERLYDDIRALDAVDDGSLALVSAKELTTENKVLALRVLEGLTDVQSQWLGNATPMVETLLAKCNDGDVSDADFIEAVEGMAEAMPDLFDKLDWHSLADAMEKSMGAAMLNGAAKRARELRKAKRS